MSSFGFEKLSMSFIKFVFSKVFLKQLILAVVAIVVLGIILLQWLKISTNHDQHIEVPDLAKMELDEVYRVLEERNLRLEILDSANYNPNYPKYSVIEQIPAAGKQVKENRKIYITLNPSGYPQKEVPVELIGRTLRQVSSTLKAMGFEIGTITTKPYIAPDVVLGMSHQGKSIVEGTKLPMTSVIDLTVGDGKERYRENQEENREQEPLETQIDE